MGRTITALQDLIRQVYVAAGQKPLTVVTSAEMVELTGGNVSRQYNLCTNRIDYVQGTAANRPTLTASDAGIGGKPCISGSATRFLSNATNPNPPGTTVWYQKSVVRLDSWPPGGKAFYGSTANRFGVYTRSTPDSVIVVNSNVASSPPVDMPLGRWGVLTFRMGNTVADFVRFGATLNVGSGTAVGNTDPASIGKFNLAAGGSQGVVGSEAIQFVWTQALTVAEDQAVDDLLNAYLGGSLLIYSSTGHIRSAGVGWLGSSQTRGNAVFAYDGARYTFWHAYGDPTGLNYPTWTSGLAADGTFPQNQHTGISSQGIDYDSTGPNPGSGLAVANAYFSAAGATPSSGAGSYRWINLELGGADVAFGTYVAGTSAAHLLNIAVALKNANPNATIAINTICPQLGDPPGVVAFSNEIRGAGGVWDQYDALYPTKHCDRVDLNYAVSGGTGLYNAANFIDNLHLNLAGNQLWGNEIVSKSAASMSAATLY